MQSEEHQAFKRWVMESVSMPAVPADLQAEIADSEPEDLRGIIAVVRAAETCCIQKLEELNRRTRPEQQAADKREWARTIQLLVRQGELMGWDSKIKWLQEVRRHLEQMWGRSETAGGPTR